MRKGGHNCNLQAKSATKGEKTNVQENSIRISPKIL